MVNVGNALSPYWHAFTLAALGSSHQRCGLVPPPEVAWSFLLPACAPSGYENRALYARARQCRGLGHGCATGWPMVAQEIGTYSFDAIVKYHRFKSLRLPTFAPNEWLFYDRCELFTHDDYGPLALSALRNIPFGANDVVSILSANDRPICRFYQRVRQTYLLQLFPSLTFVHLERKSLAYDFARLCLAPRVVIPWRGSSWALWATIGNLKGTTYMPPINNDLANVHLPRTTLLNDSRVLLPRAGVGTAEIGLQDINGNLNLITARHRLAFKKWLTL